VVGYCKNGNETSDCIKAEEFITKIATIIFLRRAPALWS
jgi:hypothetical protein